MFSILLVIHLRVEFPDHRVTLCLTVTTEAAPFYIPIQPCMRVQFLHSLLLLFSFFL